MRFRTGNLRGQVQHQFCELLGSTWEPSALQNWWSEGSVSLLVLKAFGFDWGAKYSREREFPIPPTDFLDTKKSPLDI